MGTITDYLDWRGDLRFSASPFNEVDNYILSKIGTADWSGIVPRAGGVSLSSAVKQLRAAGRTELNILSSKQIIPTLLRLPELNRYRELTLWDYEDIFSPDESEQFSGLTVGLPDGTRYVSFRGTDDSLIGWKEDLLMGVEDKVKAQEDAARYLCRVAEELSGPLIVGGHSKGGNLAVYAAAAAPAELQERIVTVYNNDGPGFKESFLESAGYRNIRDKVITLISRHSIVGTLLTQDKTQIVESTRSGVAAHDGFNWEVLGGGFVRCEGLSRSSELFDTAIQDTLDTMSLEDTRRFVEGVFDVLGATGADTVRDITENKLRSAVNIAGALRQDTDVKRFVLQFLEASLREIREEAEENREEAERRWLPGKRKNAPGPDEGKE